MKKYTVVFVFSLAFLTLFLPTKTFGQDSSESGTLLIKKYYCPEATALSRAENGPNQGGSYSIPTDCLPDQGKTFGRIFSDNIESPDNETPPADPQTFIPIPGSTDTDGTLSESGLETNEGYIVAELDSSGNRLADDEILGFFCQNWSGEGTDNYEFADIEANQTLTCVAYNKAAPQITTGNLVITKYLCSYDTTVLRDYNGPDSSGNIKAPATCSPQAEKSFGYVFEQGKENTESPYAGIDDDTAFTAFSGQTNAQGQLSITGLAPDGRYNIAEIDNTGARIDDSLLLGTFCLGGAHMGSNNFDMTFVTAGETTWCASYNKGPEPVTTPPAPETSSSSGGGNSAPGGNAGPTAKEAQEQNQRQGQESPTHITPAPAPQPAPATTPNPQPETSQAPAQEAQAEVILAEEEPVEEVGEAEEPACAPMTFEDVSTDNPNYQAIKELWCKDIIHGRTPSEFAPNAPLLRSEAAKIIARTLGYIYIPAEQVPQTAKSYYKDMSGNEPLAYYIEALTEAGIFQGREDGTFGYDEAITVNEMIIVLQRLGFEESDIRQYRIGSLIQRDQFAEFMTQLVD